MLSKANNAFGRHCFIAALLSISGAIIYNATATLLSPAYAFQSVLILLSLAYGLFILSETKPAPGRYVAFALWLILSVFSVVFSPKISILLVCYSMGLWLLRSLIRYTSLLPALTDAGLILFALASAYVALLHSHSLALALWSFFLVQALTTFIPASFFIPTPLAKTQADKFNCAYRTAENALKRLTH